MSIIINLEKLLATGQDSAMLRFSLGKAYLDNGTADLACAHLNAALQQNPLYSAAWNLFAQGLTQLGKPTEAIVAYQQGIAVAEQQGDKQAAQAMRVFLRRLQKLSGVSDG